MLVNAAEGSLQLIFQTAQQLCRPNKAACGAANSCCRHIGKESICASSHHSLFLRLDPNAVALSSHAAPPLPRCHCAHVTCQLQEQQQEHNQQQPTPSGSDSVPVLTSRALSIAQRVAGYAGEDPDELRSNSSIDDLLPEVPCPGAIPAGPALQETVHRTRPCS